MLQLLTLNIYVCHSLIVLGLLTVKFALGVTVLFKSNVIVAQDLLAQL